MTMQHARREKPRVARVAGEVLLWFAAVGGLVCIALVVLAWAFDITLMMFRTGSMAPTIPAGSVAIVKHVPAAEIDVGDIVTVDRDEQLPVTHRVTSIEEGSIDAERVITMRGDANASDDPHPYAVTGVRTVLFAIPGLAPIIVWFSNPYVLGGITIAAGVLVGWAFWPRAEKLDDEKSRPLAREGAP
ncbi:signal peptidase I [Microbacterium sp. G2-8]|uniref:signal peptidase I n=1 Tax=Microbacterium sp. G2-8 TaxID=2842454 RepID=UPI001C8A33C8|nr:signal peptidase I [Microbacterium sp. G2-8]